MKGEKKPTSAVCLKRYYLTPDFQSEHIECLLCVRSGISTVNMLLQLLYCPLELYLKGLPGGSKVLPQTGVKSVSHTSEEERACMRIVYEVLH